MCHALSLFRSHSKFAKEKAPHFVFKYKYCALIKHVYRKYSQFKTLINSTQHPFNCTVCAKYFAGIG